MGQNSTSRRGQDKNSREDANNGAIENPEAIYATVDENEVQTFPANAVPVNVENQEYNNSNRLRSADSSCNIRVESDIRINGPLHPSNNSERSFPNSDEDIGCCNKANLFNRCGKHLFKIGFLSALITLLGVVLFVYGLVVSWAIMTISGIVVFVFGVLTTCSLFPIFYRLQKCRRRYSRSTSEREVHQTSPHRSQHHQVEYHLSRPLEYDPPPVYSTIPLPASLSSPTNRDRDFQSDLVHNSQGVRAARDLPPSYHDAAHF